MSTSPRSLLSAMKLSRSLTLLAFACLLPGLMLTGAVGATPQPEEERLLQSLRQGGVVALIRHAATDPGVGDPPGFKLGDCATQRNLSESGREQARRLGRWFEANGIRPTSVRTSPWCRARETATLAFGRSEDWAALSNLLGDRRMQHEHAGQVQVAIDRAERGAVDVLVSHGVSINAFIGVYLQQGEMVVVRPGHGAGSSSRQPAIEVVGRLLVP